MGTGILLLSILVQVAAAALALRLVRITGYRRAWIAIACAILLMGLRRVVTLANVVSGSVLLDPFAEAIALAISGLMLLGVAAIGPLFGAIQESQHTAARFGRILDQSLNEIYVFDADSLEFVLVNRGARENLGYTLEELKELTPLALKPEFTADSFAALLSPLRSGAVSEAKLETLHRRKDGSTYPVEVHLQLAADETSSVFVAIILDVTDRRALEARLRAKDRLEAIGSLAGGIAHDFNNYLTVILGKTELLESRLPKESPIRADLADIALAADLSASLTRQLLAFGRRQPLEPQTIDLNALVEDIERMLQRLIGEDVELRLALEPKLRRVFADPSQIEQVIVNLVINARDAVSDGGRLSITTENVWLDQADARWLSGLRAGHHVRLSVSDTGTGMDAETQARIFEPFFSTKKLGRGTGLGLATVLGIVQQSGGAIGVSSEPGHGTTFEIYLPAVGVEDTAHAEGGDSDPPLSQGSGTILLVEDERAVREVARAVLEEGGYEVLEAADGREALALAEAHPGRIDLLLTDVIMPRLGGVELAAEFETLRPDVRVLFMSGYAADAELRRAQRAPGASLLMKPFPASTLLDRVRSALSFPRPPDSTG